MDESCAWECMKEEIVENSAENIKPVIEVNDILQVKVTGEKESHFSRVNNILEDRIIIAWPTNRGIRMPLRPEQPIELAFMRDAVPYAFNAVILETNPDPLPQVTIRQTISAQKAQRRQNFRVKCMMPVQINGSIWEGSGDSRIQKFLSIQCVTYDLSAGGLSIRNATKIPENTLIEVKLKLQDGSSEIKIPARVVYSGSLPNNAALYHMGIDFTAITESERARIIRCLHRIQLQGLNA